MIGTYRFALAQAAPPAIQTWMADRPGSIMAAIRRAESRLGTSEEAALSQLVDVEAGARAHVRDLGSVDSRAHALMRNVLLDKLTGPQVERAFHEAHKREAPAGWRGRDAYGEQIRDLGVTLLLQNELTAREKGRRGGRSVVDEAQLAQELGALVDGGFRPPWLDAFLAATGWTPRRASAKSQDPAKGYPVPVPFTRAVLAEAPVGTIFLVRFPGGADTYIRHEKFYATPAAPTGGSFYNVETMSKLIDKLKSQGAYEQVRAYLVLRGDGTMPSATKAKAWREAALAGTPEIPDAEGLTERQRLDQAVAARLREKVEKVASLYAEAEQLAEGRSGFWADRLPNILGYLRGVPGQRYYRAPPAGGSDVSVNEQALNMKIEELTRIVERLRAESRPLSVLQFAGVGDVLRATYEDGTTREVTVTGRRGSDKVGELANGAPVMLHEDSVERGEVNLSGGGGVRRVARLEKIGHREPQAPDPLVELRARAPRELGAYGGLAWALSEIVREKTGKAVPHDYWTRAWHWPLASFAERLTAPLQDVAASLLAAEVERAQANNRVADSDLAALRSLERRSYELDEFPLAPASFAEWVNAKRGKARWNDPGFAALLHSYVPELKEQIQAAYTARAKGMQPLLDDARRDLVTYQEGTADGAKDAEVMSAFRASVGAGPSPLGQPVERRRAKAQAYAQELTEIAAKMEQAATPAWVDRAYESFLANGMRAYGAAGDVIGKAREVLAKPVPKASKPIGYVYDRFNGELQVWPVLSIEDAKALYALREAQAGHRDINAVALQGQKLADAVEVTKADLVKKGREVLTVKIHPVWP